MKKLSTSVALAAVLVTAVSCSKKESVTTEPANTEVVAPQADSAIIADSVNLRDDSATVETAVGVQDEELNAKEQEKVADEKLLHDLQKAK